jgi:hypothetical protein
MTPMEPMTAIEPRPVSPPPAPARDAPQRSADPAEIERVLRESGLEQVRTRGNSATESVPEPEFVPAKRDRRPAPPDLGLPMAQVETTRKEDAAS